MEVLLYCTECGAKLAQGAKFCSACGATVGQSTAVSPSQTTQRTSLGVGKLLIWVVIGASALVVVLVIGGFVVGAAGFGHGGRPSRSGTSNEYVEGIGIQHDVMATRNHVTEGTTVEYNSIPATSGNHWPQWSQCGFFEEGLPDERIVHNLEHSNIIVSYNLTTPEEVDELRDVTGSVGLAGVVGITRFYDKIDPGTVALSAWGVSDIMQGIDEERINEFFSTYGGTLGPEGNIPCLNSGVMPLGYRVTGLLSSKPPNQHVAVTKITVVTTDGRDTQEQHQVTESSYRELPRAVDDEGVGEQDRRPGH